MGPSQVPGPTRTQIIHLAAGVLVVALLWLVRVPAEEKMMVDRFGGEYVDYMNRTGKIFPRAK